MISLLKKRLKQELFCKERKLNRFERKSQFKGFLCSKLKMANYILHNMHVSPYEQGNRYNHDPFRTRKLLLQSKEINKLIGETKETGYTIVPLKMYLKNGYAKVLIGLGKGKKQYDKREDLKKKEAKRDIERAFRDRQKM